MQEAGTPPATVWRETRQPPATGALPALPELEAQDARAGLVGEADAQRAIGVGEAGEFLVVIGDDQLSAISETEPTTRTAKENRWE